MISITPYLSVSSVPGHLNDQILELWALDRELVATVPESIRQQIIHLLRFVNSYYSNKIEGNSTKIAEVLRASETDPKEGSATKGLSEIVRLAEVIVRLEQGQIDSSSITSSDFLCRAHAGLFRDVPDEHRTLIDEETGEKVVLVPGQIRRREVKVGRHIPPSHDELPSYLNWFEGAYRPDRIHGTAKLLAAAAAHHRIAWIHPFLDGNGRVARLFTDCYMKHAGLAGYGLWSMSRGFARNVKDYYDSLSHADMPRQGTIDGRGLLSDKGLLAFTEYFLRIATDQVKFFLGLLNGRDLQGRVNIYFELRQKGLYPDERGSKMPELKPQVKDIYLALLKNGPMSRSEIYQMLNVEERTGRSILSQMKAEDLIDAPQKQLISLKLSAHSIGVLFPNLVD